MRPHFKSVSLAIAILFIGTTVLEITPARSQWPPVSAPTPDPPPAPAVPNPPPVSAPTPDPPPAPAVPNPPPLKIPSTPINPGSISPIFPQDSKTYSTPTTAPSSDTFMQQQQFQKCLELRTSYNRQAIEGETTYTAGQFAEAEKKIQNALQLVSSTELCPIESKEILPSSNSSYAFDFFRPPQGKFGFDPASLATLYDKLGDAQAHQGKLELARENYQQALSFYQKTQNIDGQLGVLMDLGDTYKKQGKFEAAITHYQQALELYQKTANLKGQLTIWLDLGEVYVRQKSYQKALSAYEQALMLAQKIPDRAREAEALLGQGKAQQGLRQYSKAEKFCREARFQAKKIQAVYIEVNALLCLGDIYVALKKNNQVNEVHRQAVIVSKNLPVGELRQVITTLNGLGNANIQIGKSQAAIASLNYSLTLARRNGDRLGEITALNSLGNGYRIAGQPVKSLNFYIQAFNKQIENNDTEGAVQTKEKITALRKGNPKLAAESLQWLNSKVVRKSTGIAIGQGQLCLAFELVDLLKVVEAEDYLGNQRSPRKPVNNSSIKPNNSAEIEALQRAAIQQMQELEQLQRIPEANRTSKQKQRLEELKTTVIALFELFAQFLNSAAVSERVAETNRNAQGQVVRPSSTCAALEKQKVTLFYPLLLNDDRLALMLYIPGVGPFYKITPISRATLTQEVSAFQAAILAKEPGFNLPNSKMRQSAQRMYQRLLEPFALDLKAANVQTIVYASDDILRYVPLAALHTGNQWLIENYKIQYIVASSITDFNTPPKRDRRALAGAFATGQVTVPLGKQPTTYSGLTFAKPEIDNLKARIPNTTQLVDRNFSVQAVLSRRNQYTLMHFATHASFGSTPDDSYILFGNGYSTLRDIESWNLKNIDLLTLGACATAFGGQLGDGREILGFGYQTHKAGAKATLASLWAVQDDSTQVLMDRFYAAFAQGRPKVEAIRQAQLDLLSGKTFATPHQKKTTQTASITGAATPGTSERFDHPYYWAPFILIGNGL